MSDSLTNKDKILVADDSEMNRELLTEMLEDDFEVIEAEDGEAAVAYLKNHAADLSLVLLDIVMPKMDGFEVLAYMNKYHWISEVPVIIISSETAPVYIERAYDLGASDFISRPFNFAIVQRRVMNAIALYNKQRRLVGMVADQIVEREKSNSMMITILSHIVEFRNGESGLHVLHVQTITELLLKKLMEKTDKYTLTPADISHITLASALHDIGKISIPDEILNKPGRFTPEEFAIMKRHSEVGADMLRNLPLYQDEPIVKVAYEICRWHHERWDGRGYPDGISGDDIPISAQIVALADVYDALTSERCYKKAIPHEEAAAMILRGECGAFNPLLLECLNECRESIRDALTLNSLGERSRNELSIISDEILEREELTGADRLQRQLDVERSRLRFNSDSSDEILFTYLANPPVLTLSSRAAKLLRLERTILNPIDNAELKSRLVRGLLPKISDSTNATTWKQPNCEVRCNVMLEGYPSPCRVVCRTLWSTDPVPQYMGVAGRIIPEDETAAIPDKLTFDQAEPLLRRLSGMFDRVRLVSSDGESQYSLDENGKLTKYPYASSHEPEGGIAMKAINQQSTVTKFTFSDDTVYYIMALYMEVDSHPYSLELMTRVDDDVLFSSHGSNAFVNMINQHNKKLYNDALTGVFNRYYYDETVRNQTNIDAVAFLDMDNLKIINDTYGHVVGDMAIKSVATAILSCVRGEDAVIRYGGDEFIVVFHSIPHDTFVDRLERIRDKVGSVTFRDYPVLRLSVSVGGEYGSAPVHEMVLRADKNCYRAKERKNSVSVGE